MLPIIDLRPSDDTCMYSTLSFVKDQAEQLRIAIPCITFDQPFWWKAAEIIEAIPMVIVCKLTGFPTIMSFFGSVGSLMNCAGFLLTTRKALSPTFFPESLSQEVYEHASLHMQL